MWNIVPLSLTFAPPTSSVFWILPIQYKDDTCTGTFQALWLIRLGLIYTPHRKYSTRLACIRNSFLTVGELQDSFNPLRTPLCFIFHFVAAEMISVTFFLLSATASLFLGSAAAQEAETCVVGHESCQDPLTHNRYPSCIDENLSCPKWAAEGQCDSETYEKYMKIACRKSCPNVCNHRYVFSFIQLQRLVFAFAPKEGNLRCRVSQYHFSPFCFIIEIWIWGKYR